MKRSLMVNSLGVLGAVTLTALSANVSAEENPFQSTELTQGYEIADNHGKAGEGKCGEGACGGAESDDEGGKSDSEGKCGEGTCGS